MRIRRSPSFRIGILITQSIKKPWRLIFLPILLSALFFQICLERLGKKSLPVFEQPESLLEPRNCVIMFPTNGVGFGHFTRLLAISRRIRKLDPTIEIIFITTMPTLHLLKREGIPAYHLAGKTRFKSMDAKDWNKIVEEIIVNVFLIHRPKLFVFDGVFPHRGILNSIQGRRGIKKVWLKRGMFKKGKSSIPVDSINHFDTLIFPKDSISHEGTDLDLSPEIIRCEPIFYADEEELRPRSDLRKRLGIPIDSKVCYLQLGAGEINDIESDIRICLSELEKYDDLYVVLGESMLGQRLPTMGDRVRVLSDYPNSLDFRAFDFSIMAGGYNSYHEAIQFQLPTICIPNLQTGRDDQLARSSIGEKGNAMIVVKNVNAETISIAISKIMNDKIRKRMSENCLKLQSGNGAEEISKWIVAQINN